MSLSDEIREWSTNTPYVDWADKAEALEAALQGLRDEDWQGKATRFLSRAEKAEAENKVLEKKLEFARADIEHAEAETRKADTEIEKAEAERDAAIARADRLVVKVYDAHAERDSLREALATVSSQARKAEAERDELRRKLDAIAPAYQRASDALTPYVKNWELPLNPEDLDELAYVAIQAFLNPPQSDPVAHHPV